MLSLYNFCQKLFCKGLPAKTRFIVYTLFIFSLDRCEELQLELTTTQRGRNIGVGGGIPLSGGSHICGTGGQNWPNKGTEIERIMAKIEQDNRILAELDHSRSTTLGKFSSA